MNVERIVIFVIQRQLPKESNLIRGNLARDYIAGRVKVGLGAQTKRRFRVLLKGAIATRYCFHPGCVDLVEKVQQHLLVISPQTDDTLGILADQIKNMLDATG